MRCSERCRKTACDPVGESDIRRVEDRGEIWAAPHDVLPADPRGFELDVGDRAARAVGND